MYEIKTVFDPTFKYTNAEDSRAEEHYLRKKFARMIAEEKAKQEAKQQPTEALPQNVKRWRQA